MYDIQAQLEEWLARPTLGRGTKGVEQHRCALGTYIGLERTDNQDRVMFVRISGADGGMVLGAICDGMGGMKDGAICAQLGLSAFVSSFINSSIPELSSRLRLSAIYANQYIYERYKGRGGTTLSAVAYDSHSNCIGVNVGDSRIYSISSRGKAKQESEDDSVKQHLLRIGVEARIEEGLLSPDQLAQYVGIGSAMSPHTIKLSYDNEILITSDGAHYVGDEALSKIILHSSTHQKRVDRMLYLAEIFGGHDNASVISFAPSKTDNQTTRMQVELWDSFEKMLIYPSAQLPDRSQPARTLKLPFDSNEPSTNVVAERPPPTSEKPKNRKRKYDPDDASYQLRKQEPRIVVHKRREQREGHEAQEPLRRYLERELIEKIQVPEALRAIEALEAAQFRETPLDRGVPRPSQPGEANDDETGRRVSKTITRLDPEIIRIKHVIKSVDKKEDSGDTKP